MKRMKEKWRNSDRNGQGKMKYANEKVYERMIFHMVKGRNLDKL